MVSTALIFKVECGGTFASASDLHDETLFVCQNRHDREFITLQVSPFYLKTHIDASLAGMMERERLLEVRISSTCGKEGGYWITMILSLHVSDRLLYSYPSHTSGIQ